MDIFAAILQLDETIFFLINSLPHPTLVDLFFLFFSFYPLIIWLLIGVIAVVVEERKDKLFIIRLILALCVAGAMASGFIKPIIRRPRPDMTHGDRVVIVEEKPAILPWNNDFAFPSGHAAVAFAGAYVVTREETSGTHSKRHSRKQKKLMRWLFMAVAYLTAISRIYLGKHYPLDIFAGGLLGWGVGWLAWKVVDIYQFKKADV